ncbi:hypothetical protein ABBQ38_009706 [Trebouxia sp. C0009 RCD-2024]
MVGFQGVASVLLIAGAVLFAQWQRQNPIPPAKFVEIRPGLHRLNYVLNLRVFAPAHVAVWLVESSPNSWILVDAGTPSLKHQRAILKGLQATLSSAEDTLRLVLVTHAHSDHTGALGQVVDAYPNVKVACHEREEVFLSGGKSYADLPGDNLQFNILKRLMPGSNSTMVPSSRLLLLKGQSGDVSDVFTYANWLPKGVLEYHAVPGHTPGQVAFFHKPTGSVIAADTFVHMSKWWPFSSTRDIGLGYPIFSANIEMVKGSQQNLAVLPGTKTIFPSHDAGNGASAKAVKEFVMA